MKLGLIGTILSLFLMQNICFGNQAYVLEVHYLKLIDPMGDMVKDKAVPSGTELTLEIRYRQSGFPKEALTSLRVEVFDSAGNSLIHEDAARPCEEGTRMDRYKFTVPEKISGQFLAVMTIKVADKDNILSEVTKTAPFDVKIAKTL